VGARKVVLVSETAARRFWPNQDAVGKPVSVGQGGFWNDTAYVIGVVGDVRFGSLDSLPDADVYLSFYQSPYGRMMLFTRTAGDPLDMVPTLRRTIHELAPDVPVYDVQTMSGRTRAATAYARFSALLMSLFGLVALALATLGVYGVVAFAVAQRTREIGIRTALGATRGDVMRLVVGQSAALAAAGVAIGLTVALAVTGLLRSLLYGVTPNDPTTFAAIIALLALAVFGASWIPARRASRIDPAVALRET
jgi:predicted lysophospholipase L1 biosynthesis ABC-type transport system permease subunit